MGGLIFIVIVGALCVFLVVYGRNGRHDNWLTRPIISNRNGRVEFFGKRRDISDGSEPKPSFLRTLAVSGVGLVAGLVLAFMGSSWAAAFIISAVIVPAATAYHVKKDGGTLRWTWRTSDDDPSDRGQSS
jgi:hypothetical protein